MVPSVMRSALDRLTVVALKIGVTVAIRVAGAVLYILLTPHREITLIREGNTAYNEGRYDEAIRSRERIFAHETTPSVAASNTIERWTRRM